MKKKVIFLILGFILFALIFLIRLNIFSIFNTFIIDEKEINPIFLNNVYKFQIKEEKLTKNFFNKSISYENGKIMPQIREEIKLNDYFASLEINEEYIYALVIFKENLVEKQKLELSKDGVRVLGYYGDSLYLAKFPKTIIETKTYDFIKWIEIPKAEFKLDGELKNSLSLNNSLLIRINFYESFTDEELKEINRYAKFINLDDWKPNEGSIYALVGPRYSNNSLHPVEEIANLNFIKSLKLINIEDKRKLNLFINQSEFYENKTLINQPHAICPWQKKEKSIDLPFLDKVPTIISNKEIRENESFFNNFLNKDNIFRNVYMHSKAQGYSGTGNYFEFVFSDGTNTFISELNKSQIIENNVIFLVFVTNSQKNIERSYIMEIKQNKGESPSLIFYDQKGGTEIRLSDRSIVSSWGNNSCTFNECLIYGFDFYSYLLGPCIEFCTGFSFAPVNPYEVAVCYGCALGLGISALEICAVDQCEFYPCQEDCNDNDGFGGWNYYCYQDDVWRRKQFTDYECSSGNPTEGSCYVDDTYWGQEEFYQSCSYGCTSGSCDSEIECYSNSDCPADRWVSTPYCSEGDVWQTWRNYSCSNPGTSSSNCTYSQSGAIKDYCSNGCSGDECDSSIECSFGEEEEDCWNSEDRKVEMKGLDGSGTAWEGSGSAIICGYGYCGENEDRAYATTFDIDDCDGVLDESMLDEVQSVKLEWENNAGESDCSDTEIRFYTQDESDFIQPDINEADLTDLDNWDFVNGLAGCTSGENYADITEQYVDDLTLDDDWTIGYAWWPEDDQDAWTMDSVGNVKLDIEYCASCPDEDGDDYHEEGSDCGTNDDCDDFNQYIHPEANIYCDCNSSTGGGVTQGMAEICDYIDNDCDGSIDESLTRGCGLGICAGGTQSCAAGTWGSCSTSYLATTEMCNSLDDDCDGYIDESLSQECGTDVGACVKGAQSCAAGTWGSCGGTYVGPTNETCNGIDDNCNGITDESNVCGNYPNVTINTPFNGSVLSGAEVSFTCSATDDSGLTNISLYHNINGAFVLNSTISLTGKSNSTIWTFNNISEGSYYLNCLAYDNSSHFSFGAQSPYFITINNTFSPNDTYKFLIKDNAGSNVAWLGNKGNIVLKGSCFASAICNVSANSFIIANSSDSTVAFINSTGDLCVEKGDCSDNSASCNPTRDAFIIRGSSNVNVSYIDFSGDLCLTGSLIENGNP